MSNGKTKSDKDKKSLKSKLLHIKRSIVSPMDVVKEKLSGVATSTKTALANLLDKSMISKAYTKAREMQGGSGGRTVSNKDFMAALKKIRDDKKKGKPHLKHGGKAKKMKTYSKGGKAK